jgi:hypothetical protein
MGFKDHDVFYLREGELPSTNFYCRYIHGEKAWGLVP